MTLNLSIFRFMSSASFHVAVCTSSHRTVNCGLVRCQASRQSQLPTRHGNLQVICQVYMTRVRIAWTAIFRTTEPSTNWNHWHCAVPTRHDWVCYLQLSTGSTSYPPPRDWEANEQQRQCYGVITAEQESFACKLTFRFAIGRHLEFVEHIRPLHLR